MALEPQIARVHRLFEQTLRGGYSDASACKAVEHLRRLGNRLIASKASTWCTSTNPRKRARGADILGQLRTRDASETAGTRAVFVERSFMLLSALVPSEQDPLALSSMIFALGHLGIEAAVPLLARHTSHPAAQVRFAVAVALGNFPNHPAALTCLVHLASNADRDVRNWALFALGSQSDADSEELRTCLANALHDPFAEAREEAIAGLAKRGDRRALEPLRKLLRTGSFSAHHEWEFASLAGAEPPPAGWTPEQLLDLLQERFPQEQTPRRL